MKLPILPLDGGAHDHAGSACGTGLSAVPAPAAGIVAPEGFAGNVALVTLGCAKNLVDSEVMLGVLKQRGFRPVGDPSSADLIVVNTCAFLQSAVEEGIDRILELSELKKSGRCRRLVVAGCMVERYRSQLESELPEVDRFISTDELLSVADTDATTSECLSEARRPYFVYDETMPRLRSTPGHTAFIKIAEGCDRPCAFCIIPKIRGRFRSRPMESIFAEARHLLSDGVRELNLVAQDLTAYGNDFDGRRGIRSLLPDLLEGLEALSVTAPPFWTRLLYAYPIGVTEDLIRRIKDSPIVAKYLDLPLQHISHPVLKSMRRPLGERGTRKLIESIRSIAPEIAIRTTFVVGFPGETDEDIRALESFVAEGHFTHAGTFTYSQEEESGSYHFPDQIEEELKHARRDLVMSAQKKVVGVRNSALIGREIRVLIEDLHPESDFLLSARAEWQAPETDGEVIINDVAAEMRDAEGDINAAALRGKFGTARITDAAEYDLVAELLSAES